MSKNSQGYPRPGEGSRATRPDQISYARSLLGKLRSLAAESTATPAARAPSPGSATLPNPGQAGLHGLQQGERNLTRLQKEVMRLELEDLLDEINRSR